MVPVVKFEMLCQELEDALSREKQAENLLYQQSCQLDELSQKLAHSSSQDLQNFKLKEVKSS